MITGIVILIDTVIMIAGIELVERGYDPYLVITIVSIISYTAGRINGDLNND